MDNNNVYIQNGYDNRQDYLKALASEYDSNVYMLADMLAGSSEDFDGLISSLEDMPEDDIY